MPHQKHTRQLPTQALICLAAISLGLVGCNRPSTTGPATSTPAVSADPHAGQDHGGADDHGHASEGPHHGALIELGNDEYHAELLHDEQSGAVTVYILDGNAKNQVPIEASEIAINAMRDGQPVQFKLAASPDANDASGSSSRFASNDKDLANQLEQHGPSPQLVVEIKGKSYRGAIVHDHAH